MSDLRERLGRLPLERRVRFLALLRSGEQNGAADVPVPRAPDAAVPLSHSQNLLWFLDRVAPGSAGYNVVLSFWLHGPLDAGALETALAAVVGRHEVLRTSLRESDDEPRQVVLDAVPVRLPVTPADGPDPAARTAHARTLADGLFAEPFDLEAGPLWRAGLIRVDQERHLFVFVVHHVVFDGPSAAVFTTELAEHYGAALAGRPAEAPTLPIQYGDFALWQRGRLTGPRLERLKGYWRERLRDAPLLDLPTDRPRPPEFTFRGTRLRAAVPAAAVDGAHRLARDLGVTPYTVYLAVLAALLRRYTQQDDLVIGCSTSVRGRAELDGLIGFFVNMLALRLDTGGDPSFTGLVRQADSVVKEGFAHVDLPFEQVVQTVAPVRDLSRSPLVQCCFLLPEQPHWVDMHGLSVRVEEPTSTTSKFDMTWQMYEAGEESAIVVEYCTDLFEAETVRMMQEHFTRLLTSALAAPDRPLSGLALLTAQERAELVEGWNGASAERPDTTLDRWFAEQAARTPDAVAVVAGEESMSYAELDARAARLAWTLRERGAERGRLVALCLPRGLDYPVAVLATLKAGAAFVPLDPTHPPERIAALVRDARPAVVVASAPGAWTDALGGAELVVLGAHESSGADRPAHGPEPTSSPGDLAYVLYTSGSTGTPKGVLIEHRNVVNFICTTRELFALSERDRVLAYAAYTFDVSVFEMFAALLTGARLHIALDTDRLDIERLQQLLEHDRISVIDLPPSVMALLEPERLTELRISFVGGEAFPGSLVNRWNRVSTFYNGYGPTECTVTMIVHECAGEWAASPPIGLPMANHVAHVLDERLEPVPYGVPGELVIGGAGLARGYLNRPELTREKFVPDPFGTVRGGRLYRTGDLVKRRRDGAIVFLGRLDRQIKIRGVRVEPGEVEAAAAGHPAVRGCHVVGYDDPRGQRHLVAYVEIPEADTGPEEVRAHLAAALPATLVPHYVVVLDRLPVTASGKIDTRALPAPDAAGGGVAAAVTEARTETEKILAEELFAPMLHLPAVDVTARFFELGGSSLQAAQIIAKIRRRFQVRVSVTDFFRDPTVAGIAALVDRARAERLDHDELLGLLDGLSDEEVERMAGDRVEGAGR
ncbi:non-ribosomal peptide synthetase [Allonocardiopsis opalescens]|uniref:Amino acid adenylation domain-containing protein n=1 Tax=Allonocardiopsis opalescens TaxID=1144618 RepID=A0A2T0PYB7_9ACTN|nr:non-ribosomal peptide synthetase [Allonocardiopsis opalescens]PRX96514.1 amino acid adenylation domain-containing protein [Allonocardiopsis opalescens]